LEKSYSIIYFNQNLNRKTRSYPRKTPKVRERVWRKESADYESSINTRYYYYSCNLFLLHCGFRKFRGVVEFNPFSESYFFKEILLKAH